MHTNEKGEPICPECGEPAEQVLGLLANPCWVHARTDNAAEIAQMSDMRREEYLALAPTVKKIGDLEQLATAAKADAVLLDVDTEPVLQAIAHRASQLRAKNKGAAKPADGELFERGTQPE